MDSLQKRQNVYKLEKDDIRMKQNILNKKRNFWQEHKFLTIVQRVVYARCLCFYKLWFR